MTRRLSFLVFSISLAGCAPSPPLPDPIPFKLDAGGVQLLDRPQRIDFGRTDHSVVAAMTKLAGKEPEASGPCANGARYAQWSDGTTLVFQNGDFRGWRLRARAAGLACA